MPRVGLRPSELTSGGSNFAIPEGNFEIVAAIITNHTIPGYAGSCGYAITAQPWATDWSGPATDEPTTEFLSCGPLTKFHPGNATGTDDMQPDLDYGAPLDLGEEDDVQGNVLLSATGAGPDKKTKAAIFCLSLLGAGIKEALLNGYAPNLVGLKAHFTRHMMEKPAKSTAKESPTAPIVGFGGKPGGPEAVKAYPGQTTITTQAAPAPAPAPAPATARRTRPAPVAVAAPGPVAGVVTVTAPVAAPVAAAPPPPVPAAAPVAAPALPVNGAAAGQADWEGLKAQLAGVTDAPVIAAALLDTLNDTAPGQSIPLGRLASKVITFFPKVGIGDKGVQTAVQALMKNSEWIAAQAQAFGWKFDTGTGVVTVTAA